MKSLLLGERTMRTQVEEHSHDRGCRSAGTGPPCAHGTPAPGHAPAIASDPYSKPHLLRASMSQPTYTTFSGSLLLYLPSRLKVLSLADPTIKHLHYSLIQRRSRIGRPPLDYPLACAPVPVVSTGSISV